MIKVTKTSPFTGNANTLEIPCTSDQLRDWQAGKGLIQDIMPEVSAELREFLITGITPEEWNKFIGPSEDDFDDAEQPELCPSCGAQGKCEHDEIPREGEPEKLSETALFKAIDEKLKALGSNDDWKELTSDDH